MYCAGASTTFTARFHCSISRPKLGLRVVDILSGDDNQKSIKTVALMRHDPSDSHSDAVWSSAQQMEELQDRADAFIRFGERGRCDEGVAERHAAAVVRPGPRHRRVRRRALCLLELHPGQSLHVQVPLCDRRHARRSPRSAPERRLLSEVFTISPITVPHGHSRLCSWDRAGRTAPRSPYWLR